MTLSLLVSIVFIICNVASNNNNKDTYYDYIVIGSATGGVVASRIAESGHNVLLIEAGPNDLSYSCKNCKAFPNGDLHAGIIMIPFKSWWYVNVEDLHWHNIRSMPSYWNYNKTVLNRRDHIYRAKMLGGCLSHNTHGWNRGSINDYNFVSKQNNLPNWSFQNILPIYQKIENYFGENKTMRGTNGPIEIIQLIAQPFEFKLKYLFDTIINYGIPLNNHQNGDHSDFGVNWGDANIGKYKNGKYGLFNTTFYRESSAQSYIRNIGIPSKKLTVWYDIIVERILFDNNKIIPNAIGVEYWNNNKLYSIYCKKEVILSAGAYQSPQLLILSGIGPIKQLNKFNIKPINHIQSHENIGKYGQDHTHFFQDIIYKVNITQKLFKYFKHIKSKHSEYYNEGRLDIILSSGKYNRLGYDYNDIKISCFEGGYSNKIGCQIDTAVYSKNVTIKLKSNDSRDYPKVYSNHFIDSRDYDIMVESIHILQSIFESNKTVFIDGYLNKTDQELKNIIFTNSRTAIHTVGTLSMGDNNNKYSNKYPITSKCCVRGINGLRVVDVSIWPYSTNGGTAALAFMIGEKCAQYIINDIHNLKNKTIIKYNNIINIDFSLKWWIFVMFCMSVCFLAFYNNYRYKIKKKISLFMQYLNINTYHKKQLL